MNPTAQKPHKSSPDKYYTSSSPARVGTKYTEGPSTQKTHSLVNQNGLIELGRTSEGCPVFDRPRSHHHLSNDVLANALQRLTTRNAPFVRELIDFGAVIGVTTCVPTSTKDEIIYAQRPGRYGASRFVLNRAPVPSSTVVVIVKQVQEQPAQYILITAFIGSLPEPEPWDKNATTASLDFWSSHALIWGSCDIISETQSTDCPWTSSRPYHRPN